MRPHNLDGAWTARALTCTRHFTTGLLKQAGTSHNSGDMVVNQVAGIDQLPAETNEFVGRAAELRQIDGLLRDARLITLTGPGGVGKTRVALRAARAAEARYANGVCLVEFSAVHEAELVPHTI